LFLAVVEGEVVGAVWGEKLKSMGFMIWGVVVKDGFRNSGIGTELLQHIEWTAYNDDCNWALLHADNRSSKTVDFYKKNGYDIGFSMTECAKDLPG
jgi:GNAT superfamily N-acetyltransferase